MLRGIPESMRKTKVKTHIGYNSPNQEQIVNINIGEKIQTRSIEEPVEQCVKYPCPEPVCDNPYANLKMPETNEEFLKIIQAKDREIMAANVIIHIIQNNPLIVNQLIVAEINTLAYLIQLLSGGDVVEITEKAQSIDCSCCGDARTFVAIDKIYITVASQNSIQSKKPGIDFLITWCHILFNFSKNVHQIESFSHSCHTP
jgi:hypothetical protein